MSVAATKPYVQKAYDEIKVIVNDANRQIRNFNLKTIAKVIALVAVFCLGGALSVMACLKMGMTINIAGLAAMPFSFCAGLAIVNFLGNNVLTNKIQFIRDINKELIAKLNKYPSSIRSSVALMKKDGLEENYVLDRFNSLVIIPKIQLNSYDRVKNKYKSDVRRILPGFLPNFRTYIMSVLGMQIAILAGIKFLPNMKA
ncbi:MAG: hypothetical protein K940chlam1_00619 [Candidatus Anoxychlamydiales bacterium]|nr:hypothetical protein [Candidatus Anoxychlamydiales bacterium]NGX36072.1 hypothetical protein [Candidatus Anoxychlamydiales bacterium]